MNKLFEIKNLKKYYYDHGVITYALNGISFDVFDNEYIGIMGPSGSGKTTLLNCISTFISITAGDVVWKGISISKLNSNKLEKFKRDDLGFIFQNFNLINTLSVYENIAIPFIIKHVPEKVFCNIINDMADRLEITDLLNKKVNTLSGGQKQIVSAVRAIIKKPSLILADEPTGALDSKAARKLLQLFKSFHSDFKTTILVVTHDIFTASYCKRILFLKDGKLFLELVKGDKSRQEFFNKILNVLSLLGGETEDM